MALEAGQRIFVKRIVRYLDRRQAQLLGSVEFRSVAVV
jgi:hypothetical protein